MEMTIGLPIVVPLSNAELSGNDKTVARTAFSIYAVAAMNLEPLKLSLKPLPLAGPGLQPCPKRFTLCLYF